MYIIFQISFYIKFKSAVNNKIIFIKANKDTEIERIIMKKLALSDEILMTIDKPARYIGNEVNMVKKNPEDVAIHFAMCFPDVYEIGMSHLGIQDLL